MVPGAIGGLGGVTLDVLWGYAAPMLPSQVQSGWLGLAAKLGVVAVAAWGLGRVMPRQRRNIHVAAAGAAAILGYGAVKGLAQQFLPAGTPGLSGYVDFQTYSIPGLRGLGAYMGLRGLDDFYSPAAVIQPPGTGVPQQFGRLAAYQQPSVGATNMGLMGFDYMNDGM